MDPTGSATYKKPCGLLLVRHRILSTNMYIIFGGLIFLIILIFLYKYLYHSKFVHSPVIGNVKKLLCLFYDFLGLHQL